MSKIISPYGKTVEICVSWRDASGGFVPPRAIEAGESCFVARAEHEGEYIPGKLIPSHNCVYISYGGKEIAKSSYQVLVDTSITGNDTFQWKYASEQNVPRGAILGGTDESRGLYIAKDMIEGEDVVGKFLPEHGCAYFPYGGQEHRREATHVLCCVAQNL